MLNRTETKQNSFLVLFLMIVLNQNSAWAMQGEKGTEFPVKVIEKILPYLSYEEALEASSLSKNFRCAFPSYLEGGNPINLTEVTQEQIQDGFLKLFDKEQGLLRKAKNIEINSSQLSDKSFINSLPEPLKGIQISDPIQNPNVLLHLGRFETLESLVLCSTQVTDISGLRTLKNLNLLKLYDTELSNISVLKHLIKLKTLILSHTPVSDLSALENLKDLTTLFITHSQVSNISALEKLTQLSSLKFYNSPISDISALGKLMNLTTLYLSNTKVSDISALGNLKNLTQLNLFMNPVKDISSLRNLTNLTSLNLAFTHVSDISALKFLKKLRHLNLQDTPVSEEQIEELKIANPNLEMALSHE